MDLQSRPSGLALLALAPFALSLSCSSSDTTAAGTGGGLPAASGGALASGGTTGTAAATGNGGSTSTGGTTSNGGTTGVGGTTGMSGATSSGGATGSGGSDGQGGGKANTGGQTNGGAMGGGDTGGDPGTGGGGATGAGAGGSGGGDPTDTAPTKGCGSPAGLMSGRASIDVNGKMREYILAVPADYDPDHAYKLVFGWHPWGGSAQQTASMGYFGLQSVSDGQAILVAPEGQDFQDGGLGWGNADGEDVDFLHAMVDLFSAQLCIDQNRMFSTGFSFGAMFSFTLACTENSMMRAIAPQAGNATTSGRCADGTRSVATMAFIGTDDSLLSGHRQAVQIFVERNGCSTTPVMMQQSWCDGLGSNFQPCMCQEYPDCKDGYPVIECEYKAGHQFAPSSGQTLWDFFSQF